jgi:energy-coupling factor transport system substrate-specific component
MPAKGVVMDTAVPDIQESSVSPDHPNKWTTTEIVVTATIAVAFGVVFWSWNLLWTATGGAFSALPPLQGLMYGVWLVPGVLAGLVVRRPGAAFFAATLAAVVSALLGSQWGLVAVVYGVAQGAAPELVFALRRYRATLPTALVAGLATGVASLGLDLALYYPTWAPNWKWLYALTLLSSALLVAGLGSWALFQALRKTGVLSPLPAEALSSSTAPAGPPA